MTDKDQLLVPISALQHHIYCARQCALIHVERVWTDNRYTVEGSGDHARVDSTGEHVLRGSRVYRGQYLWSNAHLLHGYADAIEERDGQYVLVEYKRSRTVDEIVHASRVQLCAQTLCLEEMLAAEIDRGYLYWRDRRRREEVAMSSSLREETIRTIAAVRRTLDSERLPIPRRDIRCRACSLAPVCLPEAG